MHTLGFYYLKLLRRSCPLQAMIKFPNEKDKNAAAIFAVHSIVLS